jgi:SAM-dependent methyltransferase
MRIVEPEWLERIRPFRIAELERVLRLHGSCLESKDLLEIGSGPGLQLQILSSISRSAVGLEIPDSWYKPHRVAGIIEYDGTQIPFPAASYDVIFSSHLLQYLPDGSRLYDEMRRVLRPGGVAIHVVPTGSCRVWTSLFHYPAKAQSLMRRVIAKRMVEPTDPPRRWSAATLFNRLLPHRHGARGNWITEHFLFRSAGWRRTLAGRGWRVEQIEPVGLWHTAHLLAGPALSMRSRRGLARVAGSSAIVILATPAQPFASGQLQKLDDRN